MLRKILPIILVLIAGLVLFGCNGDDNGGNGTSAASAPDVSEGNGDDDYVFIFDGVNVSPGQAFSVDLIEREAVISRVPSSAFEHYVSSYNYDDLVQISVTEINEIETIYFVHILDESIATANGIRFGDSVERVRELYGDDYEEVGVRMTYVIDEIEVSFFIRDDVVIDIELWMYGLLQ